MDLICLWCRRCFLKQRPYDKHDTIWSICFECKTEAESQYAPKHKPQKTLIKT
jgi:hypothetical protein